MIFFFFFLTNIILSCLFELIYHSRDAYKWGVYIQTHDQLRLINQYGLYLEEINELNRSYYKKISYQRYYIEHWYHPIIPDEDYQAEKFFHFQSKRILSSSTLKLNLKFEGIIEFYKFFYKENTAKLVLSSRDYLLINKNLNEKTSFKSFNFEVNSLFLVRYDPLISDQIWYDAVDESLPEWNELYPRNKFITFF
jgi:hypothetical protein